MTETILSVLEFKQAAERDGRWSGSFAKVSGATLRVGNVEYYQVENAFGPDWRSIKAHEDGRVGDIGYSQQFSRVLDALHVALAFPSSSRAQEGDAA